MKRAKEIEEKIEKQQEADEEILGKEFKDPLAV